MTFIAASPYHIRHRPRKRAIQYSRADAQDSRDRGVLDSPLSRAMTIAAPYSAGLESDAGPVAAWAAAFFSTMATAMIEPS